MANSKNFERQLQRAADDGVPFNVSAETVDARIDRAAAELNTSSNAQTLQANATRAVTAGAKAFENMRRVVESNELSDMGRVAQIAKFRSGYATELDAQEQTMMASVNNVRATVMPFPPDFAPDNATQAAVINGILQDFTDYDPATASRVARDAIARKNLPLCKRIADKLNAFSTYKTPFVDNSVVTDILAELADVLTTPDMVRSAGAAQWADHAEQEVTVLIRKLKEGDGLLEPMWIESGFFPTLFPKNIAPNSNAITRVITLDGGTRTP